MGKRGPPQHTQAEQLVESIRKKLRGQPGTEPLSDAVMLELLDDLDRLQRLVGRKPPSNALRMAATGAVLREAVSWLIRELENTCN